MKSDFNSDERSNDERLADLPPGTEAIVVGVDSTNATGRRLEDLGLLPNTHVRAMRRAPLGDPSLYELRGYRLCLRRADARCVRVRVEPETSSPENRS